MEKSVNNRLRQANATLHRPVPHGFGISFFHNSVQAAAICVTSYQEEPMMKNTTKITNASIDSAGLPKDFKYAIAEYIWNSFDAKATQVSLSYDSNEVGYLHSIRIADNGEGISRDTLPQSFGNFLDSLKKQRLTRSSYIRGKKGKGRFSFSLFATRATWDTTYLQDGSLQTYRIQIDRTTKESYEASEPTPSTAQHTGTTVLLEGLFGLTVTAFESAEFRDFMAQEFGWFLFLNKDRNYAITINGVPIDYRHHILEEESVDWTFYSKADDSYIFHVSYIRWRENIGDRYYYYFLNSDKSEVAKELTSFNNNAIDFHHSVYVKSAFFDHFEQESLRSDDDNNLFSSLVQHEIYRKLLADLRELLERKQKKYIREQATSEKLAELQQKRLLPYYSETAEDQRRKLDLERIVKEIYFADPKFFVGAKTDFVKAYLGFLDLLLASDSRKGILPLIEQSLSLTEKERERLRDLIG